MTDEPHIPRLSDNQFSREEARRFAEEERWSSMTPRARGLFQLRQNRLCMPLALFQEGLSALLGRPVFTHNLADPEAIWTEYLRSAQAPGVLDCPENAPGRLASKAQSRIDRYSGSAIQIDATERDSNSDVSRRRGEGDGVVR